MRRTYNSTSQIYDKEIIIMSDNYKKWYDICFSADNCASEVLDSEEAKKDLSKEEIELLLSEFGDDEYVRVDSDKNIFPCL